MFRIEFDHRTGTFVIQVLRYGIFWMTVKNIISGADGDLACTAAFPTHEAAVEYVKAIGLDKLYRDRSKNQFHDYMSKVVAA